MKDKDGVKAKAKLKVMKDKKLKRKKPAGEKADGAGGDAGGMGTAAGDKENGAVKKPKLEPGADVKPLKKRVKRKDKAQINGSKEKTEEPPGRLVFCDVGKCCSQVIDKVRDFVSVTEYRHVYLCVCVCDSVCVCVHMCVCVCMYVCVKVDLLWWYQN